MSDKELNINGEESLADEELKICAEIKSDAEEEIKEVGEIGSEADISGEEQEEKEDEVAKLKKELEAKEAEAKKYYELYLRALAELDNVRKRTAREKEEYIKYATLPLVKKFLGVVDDLERAMAASASTSDFNNLSKGLEMVIKKVHKIMEEEGVEPIEAVGKTFDPQYHEAFAIEENSEYPADTIVEEMRRGYMMHGRVIRPSLVKVNKS